jgi:hypothetical protein
MRRRWVSFEEARGISYFTDLMIDFRGGADRMAVRFFFFFLIRDGSEVQDNCGVGLRACGGWASLPAATTTRLLIPCWLHSAH